ncbi:MAG: MBL fold metallo-hydrolase [Hyphomicrobiaceae bacterium]|nr:MBL fold metallo-hydrolase [Hyphomicrobiaceae bacterium]
MAVGKESSASANRHDLRLTHFGAAGWSITDGKMVFLLDPYLSRIRFKGRRYGPHEATPVADDQRPWVMMQDVPPIDTATVDRHVPKADYVMLSHSHFNHAMDVPYIAKKTGAVVIGTESTCNIAVNGGVHEDQTLAVKGGEDYAFENFSLKIVPSLHSALSCKLYRDFGTVPAKPDPLSLDDYVEGGTLAYLLRFAGREILLFGSMNYIEREVDGLRPDIVLVASAPPRLEIHDYTARLMRCLGNPPIVIATHWDDQGLPFGASQDKALAQTKAFISEVNAASPASKVVVPLHFQTICISADGNISTVGP